MAASMSTRWSILIVVCVIVLLLPAPVNAFGAGNIPSVSLIEAQNWRHGDIEDMLKTVAFLRGKKWTSMMIKRVYFGNWLRDYSQAVDVGSLKGVSAPTIRILVWVLAFLSFGYATAEFEVTEERLGVYRPEEHIDNPKDYADNQDARKYDSRLRGPIQPAELEVDPATAMKNYIANEKGGWATSTGYIRHSFARSIHFGRVFTNGAGGTNGREADLCEALRCLGQGLHCMEDFGAHTNYCELALRELGFREVFPHTGTAAEITMRGHRIFPLVTGTFGAVDFLHSVLGEATDHFTQTEVEQLDIALKNAQDQSAGSGQRGIFGSSSGGGLDDFTNLISQIPGLGGSFADQARDLQAQSQAQEHANQTARATADRWQAPSGIPGMSPDFDPAKTAAQIYPILEFRDKIVKAISSTIAKIPGLEALIEKISERLMLFVLGLLAPFVRPIINAVSKSLKEGSSTVVNASANQQFGPWNDAHCTDPTHSMLSKDHFSNHLNSCAGRVAATILQYAAPRVIYAWQNPGVPVEEVMNDLLRVFHHPALRDESIEVHRNMFNTVRRWVDEHPNRGAIDNILSSASVKAGRNHKEDTTNASHSHGAFGGYGKTATDAANSIWNKVQSRDLGEMQSTERGLPESPRSGSPFMASPTPDFGYSQFSPPQQAAGDSYLSPGQPAYNSYQQAPAPMNYQPWAPPQFQQPYQQMEGGFQPGYGGPPDLMGAPYGQGMPPPTGYPSQQPPLASQYGGQFQPNQYPGQGGYPGQGYPGQSYQGQGFPGQGYGGGY